MDAIRLHLCATGICVAAACTVSPPVTSYSRAFTDGTMRVDYLHAGGPDGERLTLQDVVREGRWPGSRTHLIDRSNLGEYQFEVTDQSSGAVTYSRGFGSVYGEWKTTPEFKTSNSTFEESVRFPWPKVPITVTLKHRDARNVFQPLWSFAVDPNRMAPATPLNYGAAWPLFENGPPDRKVDLLIVSDGYSMAQLPKFHADAARLIAALFTYEPFKSRKSDFNIRALDLPKETSDLDAQYNIFGVSRYVLTYKNRLLRTATAAVPYDVLEILVNSNQYGGGGIFNLESTAAVDSDRSEYVFVHELAHNLAGLGDEYVGNVTYEPRDASKPEPWEPNLTTLRDPASLKWKDLIEPGTPIPTPRQYAGKVGAFEGGGYDPHGLFRPEFECIMGTAKPGVGFCRVCQRTISRIIDDLTAGAGFAN